MAQHTTVTVTTDAWVQLTNADATNVTFQNIGPGRVWFKPMTSASAPTDFTGALSYPARYGEINKALQDIWPGLSGVRLYARAEDNTTEVTISHG